mgnify:CR=1 FL=1
MAAPDRARLLVRREHPVARIVGLAGLRGAVGAADAHRVGPAAVPASPLAVLGSGLEMLRSGELTTHVVTSLEADRARLRAGGAGRRRGRPRGRRLRRARSDRQPGDRRDLPRAEDRAAAAADPVARHRGGVKVAVITLGVFFPMAINTYTGVRHADPLLIRAAGELRRQAVEPHPQGHAAFRAAHGLRRAQARAPAPRCCCSSPPR